MSYLRKYRWRHQYYLVNVESWSTTDEKLRIIDEFRRPFPLEGVRNFIRKIEWLFVRRKFRIREEFSPVQTFLPKRLKVLAVQESILYDRITPGIQSTT